VIFPVSVPQDVESSGPHRRKNEYALCTVSWQLIALLALRRGTVGGCAKRPPGREADLVSYSRLFGRPLVLGFHSGGTSRHRVIRSSPDLRYHNIP
jgi:hypothetical protein